jgi:hypothetical protein
MLLPDGVIGLLRDRNAIKTLATIARDGATSLTNIKSLKAPEPHVIVFALTDAKPVDEELVRHMEAGSLVSVLCSLAKGDREVAFQVVCSVREFQTAGPLYDKFLDELRARSVDLEGVWVLEPVDVIDRSTSVLDRLEAQS